MGANLDNELFNTAKEKRTKKLKDEKVFRKNQRRFEYDYEEDFYEPEK